MLLVFNWDNNFKPCIKKNNPKKKKQKNIVHETVNFGSPNLIKQKKKKKRRSLGAQQNVKIFLQYIYFQPW